MIQTHFDRLDAYRLSIDLVRDSRLVVLRLKKSDAEMAGQLHRAVTSIPLNIAEGAGEYSPKDKARFYRYALRSTAEVIAALDVSRQLDEISARDHERVRDAAARLIAICTRLIASTREREREG